MKTKLREVPLGSSNRRLRLFRRVLYPNKPVIDYGQRVAVLVYGNSVDTRTSETLTAFGDAILGLGLGLAFAMAMILCGLG